jgi:DNA repair exonuclease SbcCD ATPase subunit
MIRKLLIVAAIGVAACFALKGTRMFGYASQEVSSVADWVDSKVPVEKKIRQLRKEVGQLDREIEKAGNELAKEIVEVDYLANDITRERDALAMEEKKVRTMGEAISHATEKVVYGTMLVSADEAKNLLADDVKRLVTRKETVSTMQETLTARERIKDALMKQVDGIKRQKRELTVAIDRLEADFKRLQLQQIESKYQFDDTQLAAVKQSLKDLQKDIDVKRAKLKLAPTVAVETGAPANNLSVDEILSPLGGNAKPVKKTN